MTLWWTDGIVYVPTLVHSHPASLLAFKMAVSASPARTQSILKTTLSHIMK